MTRMRTFGPFRPTKMWGRNLALAVTVAFAATAATLHSAEARPYGYVFNARSGNVSIINTDAQEVIFTVDAGLRIRWFSSRFFDGKRVWAVDGDMKKAEVVVFDPWTLKTLKRIPFGTGPSFSVELTPDLKFALAAAAGSNEIVVIDTETYEITKRIPTGNFPCDLTLSLDGGTVYEPDRDQDTVSAIDWRSGKTLRTVSFAQGSKPHMLTLSPDGGELWVQEREGSAISVIDTKTFERVDRFPVGNKPATNEFVPDSPYTVTTHLGDKLVKVFDAGTRREVVSIETGKAPVNSTFRPDGKYAYVSNRDSGTVSVIETATWRLAKTLAVGGNPFGIYIFDPERGEMAGNR